jgi:hypothetical protein
MKIKSLGANRTELHHDNGTIVFFSYGTPVAACTDTGFVVTSKKWSVTTSKHINQWLGRARAREVSQDEMTEIADRVVP